jgi:hypothetical protein
MVEDERRLHAEILAEPAGVMPEAFDVDDLEHLALKVALRILEAIPPEEVADGDELMPASQIALVVKERFLQHIPPGYLSCLPLAGAGRFFVGQTYQLRTKIPREVVRTALGKSDFLRVLE